MPTPAVFVTSLYQGILRREPTSGALNPAVAQIDMFGSTTRAPFADGHLASAEAPSVCAPPARLYRAYFDRLPDAEGLDYWANLLKTGAADYNAISSAFVKSDEFQAVYEGLSDEGMVTKFYQNVLGREPDDQGKAYWI